MVGGFSDWGWGLAFFPIWMVMALVWYSAAATLKRHAGPRTTKLLEGSATLLSICCAAGIMMTLDCSSMIQISFLDPVCRAPLIQTDAWQMGAWQTETWSQITSLL